MGLSEGSRRKSLRGMTHFRLLRKQFLHNNSEHVAINTQLRRLFLQQATRRKSTASEWQKAPRSGALELHRAQDLAFGALGKQATSPDPLPKGCLVTRHVPKSVCVLWGKRREHGPEAGWFPRSVVPPFPGGSWGAESSSQDWSCVLQILERILRWKHKVKSSSRQKKDWCSQVGSENSEGSNTFGFLILECSLHMTTPRLSPSASLSQCHPLLSDKRTLNPQYYHKPHILSLNYNFLARDFSVLSYF